MIYRSICGMCKHLSEDEDLGVSVCPAFPEGIPDEIRRQGFDHRNEFPGDQGIRFEPEGRIDLDRLERIVASGGVPDDNAGTNDPAVTDPELDV